MSQVVSLEETSFSFSSSVPTPRERRQQERHLTILRVGTLLRDGVGELCLIRNISAGGAMVHAYSDLQVGDRVAIELKTNQRIDGEVAWLRGSNAGIAFDTPVDVAELLATPPVLPNGWKPRMPRVEIDRLGRLRAGARLIWVSSRDISQGGVKIETGQQLETGSEVVVSFEHLRPLQGVVSWQKNGICGIRFNQLIPFEELIDWLKRDA